MSLFATMAPGVYGQLRRLIPAEHLPILEEAFTASVESGGLEDAAVPREEGASYNPRCARVCQILLEARVDAHEVLAAGILVPGVARPGITPATEHLCREFDLIALSPTLGGASINAQLIFLALRLDELRHLHLSSHPPPARQALIINTRNALATHSDSLRGNRLLVMVQSWLDRHGARDHA